jgi:glycosyltransferase involved in cell wall biosynthesis
VQFSLILATVGRTDELRCFLASLYAQTHPDFELIVVDQNPDNRLAPVLGPYVDKFPITHVRIEGKGLSRARNVGLKHVSGDVVAFPDDDCWYPPDLLARVAQFFASYPERDGLTVRLTDAEGKDTMARFDTRPGILNKINMWKRHAEATLFLRRTCIEGTWFDEELGIGAGTPWGANEGADYLLRLLDQGASLYWDPSLSVFHPQSWPPYNEKAVRKGYAYGCGMGHMLQKHKLPLWFKAWHLIRPLGGVVLSVFSLKFSEAKFRWSVLKGRLRGLLS